MAHLFALEERRRLSPHPVDQAIGRLEDARTPASIIAELRTHARRLIGADGIAIILREGDDCHYVEEDAIGPLWKGSRFPMASCVSGWAMLNRKTAVIPDILVDERVPQAAYRETFVRSMAMAPFGREQPQGALGAYWAHKYTPTAEEIRILEDLAAAAGRALARIGVKAPRERRPRLFTRRIKPAPAKLLSPEVVRKLLPSKPLPFVAGQLVAFALVAVSAVLRAAAVPFIGSTSIFATFVPAILIGALWGGPRAALSATLWSTAFGVGIDISLMGSEHLAGRAIGWLLFALIGGLVGIIAAAARDTIDVQRSHVDALENRERELASITRELDHRSRNTLAVATALAVQAARSSTTTDEMRDKLTAYFGSMSATQTLLHDVGNGPVQLRELIERVLLPFVREDQVQIAIADDITVPAGREVMLSLAFSELATNACKYGALSAPNGQVLLTGKRSGNSVEVLWSESGGPKVEPPKEVSTGSRFLARALADVPGGDVQTSYLPAGLTCKFRWLDSASVEQG
jgi:two-component sensor histidine kinase